MVSMPAAPTKETMVKVVEPTVFDLSSPGRTGVTFPEPDVRSDCDVPGRGQRTCAIAGHRVVIQEQSVLYQGNCRHGLFPNFHRFTAADCRAAQCAFISYDDFRISCIRDNRQTLKSIFKNSASFSNGDGPGTKNSDLRMHDERKADLGVPFQIMIIDQITRAPEKAQGSGRKERRIIDASFYEISYFFEKRRFHHRAGQKSAAAASACCRDRDANAILPFSCFFVKGETSSRRTEAGCRAQGSC